MITKIIMPVHCGVRPDTLTSTFTFTTVFWTNSPTQFFFLYFKRDRCISYCLCGQCLQPQPNGTSVWGKFSTLSQRYSKIYLKFNAEKSEVVLFNWSPVLDGFNVDLNGVSVAPKLENEISWSSNR